MNELLAIKEIKTIDSREVAQMVSRDHNELMKTIRIYVEYLGQGDFTHSNFFIEHSYLNSQNKKQPCYMITRKGCDMVANKMTGEKGVIFTAAYVTKFESMEEQIKNPLNDLLKDPIIAMRYNQIQMEERIRAAENKTQLIETRLNSIDGIEIQGDDQQKLNAMIRKYALKKGFLYNKAWGDFKQAFNTAYHTNLETLIANHRKKYSQKALTLPQYLKAVDKLQDALRVADKMLNMV